jgi:hypothetical protein
MFSISAHSLISSRIAVSGLGLKPLPPGQTILCSSVPLAGHCSQSGPQALAVPLQQHADLLTSSSRRIPQMLTPEPPARLLIKHQRIINRKITIKFHMTKFLISFEIKLYLRY